MDKSNILEFAQTWLETHSFWVSAGGGTQALLERILQEQGISPDMAAGFSFLAMSLGDPDIDHAENPGMADLAGLRVAFRREKERQMHNPRTVVFIKNFWGVPAREAIARDTKKVPLP